jgi:type I restriction enzyme S subunit
MKPFKKEKFKRLVEVKSGYTWEGDQESNVPLAETVPVLTVTNVQASLVLDSLLYLKNVSEKAKQEKKATKNWIIAVNSNGNKQRVGQGVFIDEDTEYLFASFLIGFKPFDENILDPKFFFYWYSSEMVQKRLSAISEGTTGLSNLEVRYLRNMEISFPENITEQQRIASILSSVDDTIKATRASIAKLERLKKSLMQNLLTGKMKPDGTWRNEDEFYMDEKYGRVPVGWKFGRLSEIAEIEAGQSPPGEYYNHLGQGLPILNGPAEFTDRFPIPVQYTTKVTKLARPGDILFCVRGSTTGRMNFADQEYCIGRGIAAIRPSQDYEISFLYYTLLIIVEKLFAIAKSSGTTFPNVNRDELKKKAILYPEDLSVRNEIAGYFCSIDKLIDGKIMKISKLEKLKKSLMQKLLTGQVRIK